MERDQNQINDLDPDERRDNSTNTIDQQIIAQELRRADRAILPPATLMSAGLKKFWVGKPTIPLLT